MEIDLLTCTSEEAISLLLPIVDEVTSNVIMPIAMDRDPENTGGWFTFSRTGSAKYQVEHLSEFVIGELTPAQSDKYKYFAREKAFRVSHSMGHFSSWQSRYVDVVNPMDCQYGGAIWVRFGIWFSFSGFSEEEDEALCVIVAYKLGLIENSTIQRILKISDNQVLRTWLLEQTDGVIS